LYYHTPKVTAICTTARSETVSAWQSMVHSYAANVFFLAALLHVVVTTTLLYFRRQVFFFFITLKPSVE